MTNFIFGIVLCLAIDAIATLAFVVACATNQRFADRVQTALALLCKKRPEIIRVKCEDCSEYCEDRSNNPENYDDNDDLDDGEGDEDLFDEDEQTKETVAK